MFTFELGMTARDTVTGFEGTITVRAQYIAGYNRYCLERKHSDGKVNEEWFDQKRIREVIV